MNNDIAKFGIIISCYRGDIHFTKGLLASIRYFCGDIPLCLIVDGNFSIKTLEKTYNIVRVIRKEDVINEFFRENLFGTRMTKMIAFWEAPFEYFLYLDTDTLFWGNPVTILKLDEKIDFWHNTPHEAYTEYILKSQYFDYDKIFKYTESFDWEGCHFFNSGTFISKKSIFDFEEFKEIFQIYKRESKIIFEDQGMINFLLFRNIKKNKVVADELPIQTIVPMFSNENLESTFIIKKNIPFVNVPVVIHWAGLKPNFRQNKVFNEPMNFFRKMNLKYTGSMFRIFAGTYFRLEELYAIYHIYYKNRPLKILKKIFRLR